MDLGLMEMMRTAKLIVDESLKIKQGEKVLVTTDSRIEEHPGQKQLLMALMAVMAERELDPVLLTYERVATGVDVPEMVTACAECADVIIELNSTTKLHAPIYHKRVFFTGNRRMLLLPTGMSIGMDGDEIYRMLPRNKDEFYEVSEEMNRVGKYLVGDHHGRLTAQNGTDLTFELGARITSIHTGLADKPGDIALLPAGSTVSWMKSGSANGIIVIDSETALFRGLLSTPTRLTVKDGLVVKVEGGEEAKLFQAHFDDNPASDNVKCNVAEFGLGFNKHAMLNGNSSEGERFYGAAHIGIGSNGHFDNIIPGATVEIDGKRIVENGVYQV